ncbi:MAG: sigma-70 factor [Gammaproteobacteria bacterium]|nr:MAG: sigma-70 factor [Gammaproteobacteria bacterium]TND06399.1 MAG: sigma-70 factor [Gammaproteobacteria bacterium]
MKMSRRAKRMETHHKRHGMATINLVSLMDIFTILVFFLLVNSSTVEKLPTNAVKLPESISDKKPEEMLVVIISDSDIVVADRKVANVSDVYKSDAAIIPGLKQELDYQAGKAGRRGAADSDFVGKVMIMGDREVPYKLLKKIMMTCSQASYSQIFLAVQKKETKLKGAT